MGIERDGDYREIAEARENDRAFDESRFSAVCVCAFADEVERG